MSMVRRRRQALVGVFIACSALAYRPHVIDPVHAGEMNKQLSKSASQHFPGGSQRSTNKGVNRDVDRTVGMGTSEPEKESEPSGTCRDNLQSLIGLDRNELQQRCGVWSRSYQSVTASRNTEQIFYPHLFLYLDQGKITSANSR